MVFNFSVRLDISKGSVTGPVLFWMYLNTTDSFVHFTLCADDTSISKDDDLAASLEETRNDSIHEPLVLRE